MKKGENGSAQVTIKGKRKMTFHVRGSASSNIKKRRGSLLGKDRAEEASRNKRGWRTSLREKKLEGKTTPSSI